MFHQKITSLWLLGQVLWQHAKRMHLHAGVATNGVAMFREELPLHSFHPAKALALSLGFWSQVWLFLILLEKKRCWTVRTGCAEEPNPEGESCGGLERQVRRVARFMATRMCVVGIKITYGVSS